MSLEVRRIVTGHNPAGKAIVASDERMIGASRLGRAGTEALRKDVTSSGSGRSRR
jgi:hypothetical protein